MFAALLLACQLAAPTQLVIRSGARTVNVPVVRGASGAAVRADLLGPALGATTRALPNGHYLITVGGTELDVAEHVPFVRAHDVVFPLVSAPSIIDGRLVVPLQLLSEILPRLSHAFAYDTVRDELRVNDTSIVRTPVVDTLHVASAPPPAAASRSGKRRHLVVVDAGHGGPDNGMNGPIGKGPKVVEKSVTLAVATRLAAALRARGYDVLMTRTTDTLIALSDRGRIANAAHADLFISVHVNAANPNWKNPAATRGFETYFLAEAKTEDAKRVEAMENEVVKYEIASEVASDDPLSFIVHDMEQNQHLRESSELAATVQRGLGKIHPGPNRGVKQAGFRVLVTAFMPAVLIEIGFGTNAAEARYLRDAKRQREIATSIADATMEYLAAYHRRTNTASQ